MKKYILMFSLIFSFAALAGNEKLIEACTPAATEVLQTKAFFLGEELISETIHACEVDNRAYNPFKYVWFCGTTKSGNELDVLMVKLPFQDCVRYGVNN